ncbi:MULTISPECIES: PGN_0703 family putative restriction endonuclease [Bacteroides]|uniref:PGN_0703 family putative restriction endonuclease n=1 Tax=Bacteroides TaxID=816 RepID=UPI00189E8EBA|nr:hypothetical protein [Bacteroides finegoldii]
MNCVENIKQKQQRWALSHNIDFSDKGYVENLGENIFDGLDIEVRKRFIRASGYELKSKMMALHSSSALVVNIFQYYKRKLMKGEDITSILKACNINSTAINYIDFEVKFPISGTKATPNLDVVMGAANGMVYGFESKFVETYKKYQFTMNPYLQSRYKSVWINLDNIYKALKCEYFDCYCYLNYPQLLKHILGLKSELKDIHKFQLIYLWYDLGCERSFKHREEIQSFAELLSKDGIVFKSVTYQEIIMFLQQNHNVLEDREYIDYIAERYLNL